MASTSRTNPDEISEHRVPLDVTSVTTRCSEFTPDNKNPHLDPPGAIDGLSFVGEDALPDDVKDRLKERAIADGTLLQARCVPGARAQLTGKVVWVEGCDEGGYTGEPHLELRKARLPRHPDLGGRLPRDRRQLDLLRASSIT